MRTRQRVVAALATPILGTVMAGAVPTQAPAADQSDVVVTGVVQRQDNATKATIGKGAAKGISGATVALMWDGAPEPQPKGTRGTVTTVASATTGAAGGYALHLAPTAAMHRAAAGNDDWLNFMLITTTPDGDYMVTSLSRALVDGAWSDKGRPAFAPTKKHVTTLAYDAQGALLAGGHAAPSGGAQNVELADTCFYDTVRSVNASTRIGQFHNTSPNYGYWQYGTSSDSDIEVGIKPSGEDWEIGGTVHIGNATGAQSTHGTSSNYDQYIRTNFVYEQRHYFACGWAAVDFYKVKAIKWSGGAQDDQLWPIDCNQMPFQSRENGIVEKWSTRATKVGYAVSVLGVHLGSTSGYSQHMGFHWDMHGNDTMFCGLDDYWTGHPGIIWNFWT